VSVMVSNVWMSLSCLCPRVYYLATNVCLYRLVSRVSYITSRMKWKEMIAESGSFSACPCSWQYMPCS